MLAKNQVEGCGIESNVVDRHMEMVVTYWTAVLRSDIDNLGMSSFGDPIWLTILCRKVMPLLTYLGCFV